MSWFQQNLGLPLEKRRFIFNIWGQGGVGKTTLSKELIKIAAAANWVTAYVNEDDRTLPEIMGRLVAQLEQLGVKLAFSDRYKTYRQKKQELEADPEAPQGFSAFLGRSLTKAGLGLAKQIPGSGAVMPFVDEDGLTTQVSEWSAYVAKKLTNKDEVRLVQEPVEVLTPLFLEAIAKVAEPQGIALFFDTYERTADVLDDWLRDLCEGRYGAAPENLIVTIAGRNPLDLQHWSDYDPAQMPLGQFTEAEARQFLRQKGITDEQVIEVIFSLSDRLPVLLALLASNCPTDPAEVGDCSGSAVQRFLQWETDPQRRQLALDGALPLLLNRDVVAVLAGEEQAIALFDWLKQMPFVEAQSEGWVYHDTVRSQMLRHVRRESPKHWVDLHRRLEDYHNDLKNQLKLEGDEQNCDEMYHIHAAIVLYHRLCYLPQKNLSDALNEFLKKLESQWEIAALVGVSIWQAGKDIDSANMEKWGRQLISFFYTSTINEKDGIGILSELLSHPHINFKPRSIALGWRGITYKNLGDYQKALEDFDEAIKLNPEVANWIIEFRGSVYFSVNRYEEAVQDLSQAIEVDANNTFALHQRGSAYLSIGRHVEALQDFDRVIELNPKDSGSILSRGLLYSITKNYEKALQEFNRVVDVSPHDINALLVRGNFHYFLNVYRDILINCYMSNVNASFDLTTACQSIEHLSLKSYEEIIEDFSENKLIYPESVDLASSLGVIYHWTGQHQKALENLNKAISLDQENIEIISERGEVYLALSQYREAIEDFDKVIKVDEKNINVITQRGESYLFLKQYENAINDFTRVIKYVRDEEISRFYKKGQSCLTSKSYEDAIRAFDQAHALASSKGIAIQHRLEIFSKLNLQNEYLVDLNSLLTIKLIQEKIVYMRALAYKSLNQIEPARVDLDLAISSAQQRYVQGLEHPANTFNLALYYLAIGNIEQARFFYRDAIDRGAPSDRIQVAIEDLEDFLTVFPDHTMAKAARDALKKRLNP